MKLFTRWTMIAVAVLALAATVGCAKAEQPVEQPAEQPPAQEQPAPPAATHEFPGKVENVTELKIEDLKTGTGAEAVPGKAVTVNYTGWLADGTKFDSSLDAGQPFTFQLGAGQVISGWDEGVKGMKVGGTRMLIIPASMGYGEAGAGDAIPPNATLVFQVDLLGVQ